MDQDKNINEHNKKYKGISLSSGSARGFYHLGALHCVDIKGMINDVQYFAGTSVGSIIALLIAIGWSPLELFTHICVDNISECFDIAIDIPKTLQHWGALDSSSLRHYIEKCILLKCDKIPTFNDLANQSIYFICTAYKLRSNKPNTYFSYKTHGDMSTLDAVMLSCNIPFLFHAQNYDGDYYVDGGCFDLNPAYYLEQFIKDTYSEDFNILSLNLDLRSNTEDETDIIKNAIDYVKEMIFIPMHNQQPPITNKHIDNINITTDLKDILSLKLTRKEKVDWFCSGLQQALNYFNQQI